LSVIMDKNIARLCLSVNFFTIPKSYRFHVKHRSLAA